MSFRGRNHPRNQIRAAAKRGTSTPAGRKPDGTRALPDYPPNWDEISVAIRRRDGFRCQVHRILGGATCSVYAPPPFTHLLHVHHIVSLSDHGSNQPRNLVTVCKTCHSTKLHSHMRAETITARQAIYVNKPR